MHTLTVSRSTSRGRDTYGYAIVSVQDSQTGKRYRTCGGGYDMLGTAFGEWLASAHQERLKGIGHLAGSYYSKAGGYQSHRNEYGNPARGYYYGMTRNDDTGRITLDGACGLRCMLDIASAIGLTVETANNRRGSILAFLVSESQAQAA